MLVTYASSRPTVPVPAQAKPYRKGEVLIRFKEGSSESDKENAATAHRAGARINSEDYQAWRSLKLSGNDDAQSVAAQLIANPNVEYAQPNYVVTKDQV